MIVIRKISRFHDFPNADKSLSDLFSRTKAIEVITNAPRGKAFGVPQSSNIRRFLVCDVIDKRFVCGKSHAMHAVDRCEFSITFSVGQTVKLIYPSCDCILYLVNGDRWFRGKILKMDGYPKNFLS